MITPSETKNLKKIIGFRHISQIAKYLREEKIKNRYNEDFSSVYIGEVFNGKRESAKIEEYIWKLADVKMEKAQEVEEQKNEIKERFKDFTSSEDPTNAKALNNGDVA